MVGLKKISVCFSENFLSVIETEKQNIVSSFQIPLALGPNLSTDSLITSLSDTLNFVDLLQKNLFQHHMFSKHVHLSLPSRDVILRRFSIPNMKASEVDLAIEFEVVKYLPFPIQDLVYHYTTTRIDEKSDRHIDVFFIAIKKTTFESYVNLFVQVGLTVVYSEPMVVSLLRLLLHCKKLSTSKKTAIVTVLKEQCELIITWDGGIFLTRDFKLSSGDNLYAGEIQTNMQMKFFNEIRLSLESFARTSEVHEVEQILLLTDNVEFDLFKRFPEDLAIPNQTILISDLTKSLGIGLDFAGALGVGLSGVVKNILDVNLCQGEGGNQHHQDAQSKKLPFNIPPVFFPIITGIVSAIVVALVFAGFERTILLKQTQINQSTQKLADFSEISTEEIQNKEQEEIQKNKSLKSLIVHTDQAIFLTRLLSLLPQGIVFETLDSTFQEQKENENQQTQSNQKVKYTVLNQKKKLKITAYAYLANPNEEVKKINEFLNALRQDDVFSKTFSNIQLGTLRVNQKNAQSITSFTLECQ